MKTKLSLVIAAAGIAAAIHPTSLTAQGVPGQPPPPAGQAAPLLALDQLEGLVGRIALYPDDLVGLILPSSTNPLEIVKAQRFLTAYAKDNKVTPDPTLSQPVFNLLNYPEVVNMMGNDLDWTEALGHAVLAQQADVMEAIQVFRRKAEAAGNLKSDNRQVIVSDGTVIKIVPAQPEVIYVPQYQPSTVVVHQTTPAVTYYPTAYPSYYYPVATTTAVVATAYWVGRTASYAYNTNWYGGGVYSTPYANQSAYNQEQRQDYSQDNQQNRQETSSNNQQNRQETSSGNQSQRQDSRSSTQSQASSNQSSRQSSASSSSSANQSSRQSTASSGTQSQSSATKSSSGKSQSGSQSKSSSSQFGGSKSGSSPQSGAFGGSGGAQSRSSSQRGGQSRSGMSGGGSRGGGGGGGGSRGGGGGGGRR